ncbi:MAG TPA: glycerate kinase [Solirubrobacteraceae bacterium]|nr:glycerate kinase [Solirubrobacteraceae bacterium]
MARTGQPRRSRRPPARQSHPPARQPRIPTIPLVASSAFGGALPAERVAEAIGRGLQTGGWPPPDLCPLQIEREDEHGALLGELRALALDARIARARAIILACARLDEHTLAGSAVFEIATRARQSGVPACAITADNRLSPFDARLLDLQTILTAGSARSLAGAGRRLAALL